MPGHGKAGRHRIVELDMTFLASYHDKLLCVIDLCLCVGTGISRRRYT